MKYRSVMCGVLLLLVPVGTIEAVTFNYVVSLGDSLLDDSGGGRSPVASEHIAERLGVPLTKFAVSGSTSSDLLKQGQHTQAASQFGGGDLAMLWIGGNDFFRRVTSVAFGLYGFIDDLEANVDAALGTLRGTGMEVIVFNLPDLSNVPLTDGISNFRKATQLWNDRLTGLAETHQATVVDVFTLFDEISANPAAFSLLGNTPIVDGPPLFGECQFCVFADSVHPSSFAQGFIANAAIESINGVYDPAGTMPLDAFSIVDLALLADVYGGDFDDNGTVDGVDLAEWKHDFGAVGVDADGDGDTDGADFLVWQRQLGSGMLAGPITTSVPEPSAWLLAALGVCFLNRRR